MRRFQALHRYARSSDHKVRRVVDLVRGMPVNRALEVLRVTPRRPARLVEKLLRSALANALASGDVNANRLVLVEIAADGGPRLGPLRWRPGPMGRAMPRRRRTCHVRLVLEERAEESRDRASRGDR